MIDEVSQNNHKPVRAKVVTITHTGPARWEVDFEGVVTRRDIHRITRVLRVEFARAQRRYSVLRKKGIALDRKAELEKATVVIQPKEITVPSKKPMTLKKVETKESVQNG